MRIRLVRVLLPQLLPGAARTRFARDLLRELACLLAAARDGCLGALGAAVRDQDVARADLRRAAGWRVGALDDHEAVGRIDRRADLVRRQRERRGLDLR